MHLYAFIALFTVCFVLNFFLFQLLIRVCVFLPISEFCAIYARAAEVPSLPAFFFFVVLCRLKSSRWNYCFTAAIPITDNIRKEWRTHIFIMATETSTGKNARKFLLIGRWLCVFELETNAIRKLMLCLLNPFDKIENCSVHNTLSPCLLNCMRIFYHWFHFIVQLVCF